MVFLKGVKACSSARAMMQNQRTLMGAWSPVRWLIFLQESHCFPWWVMQCPLVSTTLNLVGAEEPSAVIGALVGWLF